MLRVGARRGVVTGTALAVGLAGLALGQGAAHASPPLPADQAGPVAIWGPGGGTANPLPSPTPEQASQAVVKVIASQAGSATALTADGKVELLGHNVVADSFPSVAIPTATLAGKRVVDIAGDATFGSGMAITATGDVYTWSTGLEGWAGASRPSAGELQGSTAAAISTSGQVGAVVQGGSVRVWGNATAVGDHGQFAPQPDLTDATAVFPASTFVFALRTDGTLKGWGNDVSGQTDLPDVTTDASDDVDVTDVAIVGDSVVALLSDGTLTAWGDQTASGKLNAPPPTTDGKEIVALGAKSDVYFAVDSTGEIYTWGQGASTLKPEFISLPPGVDPANITHLSANSAFAIAIQATFGYVAKPTITGTPTAGQTLTANPATFTATPDDTTGQWLANGVEIPDATESAYTLTTDEIGKTITYRETATRGEATAKATSDPTAKVAPATVASTTIVAAARSTYGTRATVTVTVANGIAGNVKLSGAGAALTQPVRSGKATFALPATLRPGTYRLTAAYAGTTGVTASTGAGTLAIAKARPGVVKVKVAKANKLTRKKKAKATITVATPAGLAKASGKVTITVKKGKQTKHVTRVIRNGKVTTKLPKMTKEGKWKVTVTYTGDAYYLPASSRAIKVKVKK